MQAIRNVTASFGVEGFTADHLAAFKRHGTQRVLIAYDRDEPGERAAEKLAPAADRAGLGVLPNPVPEGDGCERVRAKLQPAEKSLGLVIRKAVWLGKGPAPRRIPRAADRGDGDGERAGNRPFSRFGAGADRGGCRDNPVAPRMRIPLADEVVVSYGERRCRVRGLSKNLSYETLKINLHIAQGDAYYVDTFDLYSARARHLYIVNAAKDLAVREEIIKTDLGRLLLKLESLQQSRIEAALKVEPAVPAMTETRARAGPGTLAGP